MAYDDELILNNFRRDGRNNNNANSVKTRQEENVVGANKSSTNKNSGVKNLKVRDVKKAKKNKINLKRTLQRGAATLSAVAIIAGTGVIASKIYRDVEVPEGFNYSGTSISSNKTLPDEIEDDFVLIEVNSWKKGISEKSIENIKKCNEQGVPCGILLESDAPTEKEAIADAACILALTAGYEIDCPIYYNIDGISDKLTEEGLIGICTSFYEMCKGEEVGISGKVDILDEISKHLPNELKLMAISDEKVIANSGDYSMCYFTRAGKYFSKDGYGKEQIDNSVYVSDATLKKESKTAIKGIDVSEYQGDIDWERVKEEDVNYAIIRFTAFNGFHENGKVDIDNKFYENVAECTRLGIPYGIYCYTRAESEAEAKAEADALIERLKGTGIGENLSLPIYFDIEMEKHIYDPKLSASIAEVFCGQIEKAGYSSGIYASYSLFRDMITVDPTLKGYEKWVARYEYDAKRPYNEVTENHIPDVSEIGKVGVIQVTQNALLSGVSGNTVDTNFDLEGVSTGKKR